MVTSPPPEQSGASAAITSASAPIGAANQWRLFSIAAGALVLLFGKVLLDLFIYGLKTDVYSHILLVPFISAYLIWQNKRDLPAPASATNSGLSLLLAACGFAILGTWLAVRSSGAQISQNDYLSFTGYAFVFLLAAITLWTLGNKFTASVAFPLSFLVFMVPFPDKVTVWLEIGSQYASAEVYSWMMDLSQATYFRQGLIFALPNLTIQVAQECSGIRSSLVLFITSLLAAYMFLKSPWKRAALALAVFPLGIARNAFRIYVLSMLSAHWNPDVIHSPLHSQGGPIFFLLSLIPFFALLVWLRKSESK